MVFKKPKVLNYIYMYEDIDILVKFFKVIDKVWFFPLWRAYYAYEFLNFVWYHLNHRNDEGIWQEFWEDLRCVCCASDEDQWRWGRGVRHLSSLQRLPWPTYADPRKGRSIFDWFRKSYHLAVFLYQGYCNFTDWLLAWTKYCRDTCM